MKKTVKVVMLPTEKATDLWYSKPRDEYWYTLGLSKEEMFSIDWNNGHKNQHLYFVSDEEISEGDAYVVLKNDGSYFNGAISYANKTLLKNINELCKKVIATTDPSLKVKGVFDEYVRQIHESFVQEYVKSEGKIDEVQVEYDEKFHTEEDGFKNKMSIQLKTRDDNTVIVHGSIKYNSDDVANLIAVYHDFYHKEIEGKGYKLSISLALRNKWIKENLT